MKKREVKGEVENEEGEMEDGMEEGSRWGIWRREMEEGDGGR